LLENIIDKEIIFGKQGLIRLNIVDVDELFKEKFYDL
jgi:hypothetical protein